MRSLLSITAPHRLIHEDWQKVLDSGVFTEGPFVRRLEEQVERLYGHPAVAFNSAGTALFAVMRNLHIPHKAALVPVNTFFATGAMVREAKIAPICVDANRYSFNMSSKEVGKMLSDSVIATMARALVYTPVGGGFNELEYTGMANLAQEAGLHFVTDAAHSLGVGRGHLGKYGPAVFSLYPTKAVPGGEGGVVICRSEEFAGELRDFRNYGKWRDPEDPSYIQYKEGFNFRMDEWTAVVAFHQLIALEHILELRAEVAKKLERIIAPMVIWDETNWYRYIVSSDFKATKTVGKVYARTDQLDVALGLRRTASDDDRYANAIAIAKLHQCLPLHEKMASWTLGQLERYLTTDWEGPV
ncbi:UDP-4-amino-4-deoxy-L-arabinose-oxoglutarate aminotransferase protein [Rhizobium phage RHph_Y1_11]|nr:UDP-4-amino-4-deoxy-L-arabinose-oxoglutarate aminotransferase protein [Rhizobium phage RHph_Y1_11]